MANNPKNIAEPPENDFTQIDNKNHHNLNTQKTINKGNSEGSNDVFESSLGNGAEEEGKYLKELNSLKIISDDQMKMLQEQIKNLE